LDLIIRNAIVVTMDQERRIIKDGAVAISGQAITRVGKSEELKGESAEFQVDGRGRIVMPGLINAHVHLSYSLAKGCGDDLPFTDWLPVVFRLEDGYSDEEWRLASQLSMAEMIKSGTTCFGDTNVYEQIDQIAKSLEESGIRGVLAKKVFDASPGEIEKVPWYRKEWNADALSVDTAVKDYNKWNGRASGRIKIGFGPQAWPGCSADGYRRVAELSRKMGTVNLVHHTESREWADFVRKNYGKEPTMMLGDFGILGPNTLLENAPIITDEEISLISRTNTRFNWLTTSNVKNYLDVVDLSKFLDKGITVSLGTSGGLINNVNDVFREMKTLALQQRQLRKRPDAISPEAVLEMATIGGAKALSMEHDVGSLEPGKKADVIVVNTDQPHLTPVVNPVSTLVYSVNGGDVETSIVDGELVMLNRKLLTIDEKELLEKSSEASGRILSKTGIKDLPSARTKWRYS